MALAGTGAICIWNDITSDGRTEFYAWHLQEHIPERVGIPGFLSGRRYMACADGTQPEFFTLYETQTAQVLTGADYLARLNAPTPWTKTATQAFRNTSRALTEVRYSYGVGPGGILATLRFVATTDSERRALDRHCSEALPVIAALPQITGMHLCLTDAQGSAARTAESRERADIMAAPDGVILIEGCNVAAVQNGVDQLIANCAVFAKQPMIAGIYRLEHMRVR